MLIHALYLAMLQSIGNDDGYLAMPTAIFQCCWLSGNDSNYFIRASHQQRWLSCSVKAWGWVSHEDVTAWLMEDNFFRAKTSSFKIWFRYRLGSFIFSTLYDYLGYKKHYNFPAILCNTCWVIPVEGWRTNRWPPGWVIGPLVYCGIYFCPSGQ